MAGTIPGELGVSTEVNGTVWSVTVEHHDGTRWRSNARVVAPQGPESDGVAVRLIRTKDRYWPGDDSLTTS